jgi:hypothetical protein
VTAVRHRQPQLSRYNAASSECGITYYSYVHDVRILVKGKNAGIRIRLRVRFY